MLALLGVHLKTKNDTSQANQLSPKRLRTDKTSAAQSCEMTLEALSEELRVVLIDTPGWSQETGALVIAWAFGRVTCFLFFLWKRRWLGLVSGSHSGLTGFPTIPTGKHQSMFTYVSWEKTRQVGLRCRGQVWVQEDFETLGSVEDLD